MAPAREGAEGAPIARREGVDDRSSRDDVDFFTPRAALVLGVCMVGALFWEEAVELRARAREVVFGEKAAPNRPALPLCGSGRGVTCSGFGAVRSNHAATSIGFM